MVKISKMSFSEAKRAASAVTRMLNDKYPGHYTIDVKEQNLHMLGDDDIILSDVLYFLHGEDMMLIAATGGGKISNVGDLNDYFSKAIEKGSK